MLPMQRLTINALRGYNTKKSITQRALNEADSALNGYFDTTGSFVKRRGFRRINETEIGTNFDIDSVYHFKDSVNDEILLAGGTDLVSYASGSPTTLTSSLNGSFFDFEEFIFYQDNYCVLTNGQDAPFKYDGTTLTNLSIDRPATAPTVSGTPNTGSLAGGDYRIRVTFLRDNGSGEIQESNPCDEVFEASVAAGDQIDLASVPVSSDPQVTGRRIYLSRPDGAILYLQGTIADNTTTTYSITTDVDVLEDQELEFDHDAAPNAYLIEKFKDRLILSGDPDFPDRVYVSKGTNFRGDAGQWYFPQGELDEANQLYFSIGEDVTSLKSYYDLVFIFGGNGNIFILTGDNESNFLLSSVKNDDNVTSLSDRAVIVQENWCYFLAKDGYYRTNGQVIQKISEPLSAWFDPENQQDQRYNVAGFSSGFNQIVPVAIYYKPLNQILLWITQAGQLKYVNNVCFTLHLNNMVQEGDVITPNWSIYTNNATRCTAQYELSNNTKYFITSQEDGFLFEAERGRFDGAAVNSTVTSSTNTTLTDTTQTWAVNTYTGLWVTIWRGTGAGQSRYIVSNTADTLTVDSAWDQNPDSTSEYTIGGIYYEYVHSYNSYGDDTLSKRLIYIRPRFTSEGDATVLLSFGYDFASLQNGLLDVKEVEISGSSLWDVAQWDVAVWDGPTVFDRRLPGTASRIHRWNTIKILNAKADESVAYDGLDKMYQVKGVR